MLRTIAAALLIVGLPTTALLAADNKSAAAERARR